MKAARLALALALLAPAMPAAAQTAEEEYQAGVAARRAGDHAAALDRLGRAAAAEPGNSDIHLQLGLTWLAMGRLDEADAAFRRTLALAPDYDDARIGLARVAQRRGDRTAALAELDRVGGPNAEAEALRRQLERGGETPAWRWRVDLDGSYTDVEASPDWQGVALSVQHRLGAGTVAAVLVEPTRRFDRTDVYSEVRVDHRFSQGVSVYALGGFTPGADYRPEWQIGGGGAFRATSGPYATVLRLDLRQADYPTGDVQTVTPGVEQYLGGNAWITGQWINVWDEFTHSDGWLVRGDVMPSDRLRLFAGASDAPDLSEGVVIEFFSLFAGVSVDVGERTTLRLSVTHDDRDGPGDRFWVGLGLGLRF